ncbi:MAG TPA: right-handed parallel beta-helix repeat-containing protein [Polyangiaceae bacterium]
MNRDLWRVGTSRQAFLLLGLCVACNGGRSDIEQEEDEGLGGTPNVSGGATHSSSNNFGGSVARGGSSWTTASGGYLYSGGYATGGSRNIGGTKNSGGSRATGGSSATRGGAGGAGAVGGRTAGGAGGVSGAAFGGISARGGVAGSFPISGGTTGTAGRSSLGGSSGNGGTPFTNAAGFSGSSGGSAPVAGAGGASGSGGASGAAGCNPARAGAPSTAGAAGVGNGVGSEWYVDSQNGSDLAPGTQSQPLKSLSCAAQAARAGDSVKLMDGTWDGTTDPALNNTSNVTCGTGAGVSFASNVSLRAVNPGAVRINSKASHGICMSGGAIEGVRFGCFPSFPIVETRAGTLTIVGSSFKECDGAALDVSGTADVTVRPGNLTDYSEQPNAYFATASEESHLTIDGGSLTTSAHGILAKDDATVTAHGVTLSGTAAVYAAVALSLGGGAPTVRLDGGSKIEHTVIGVWSADFHGKLALDDVTISNGTDAVQLRQSANIASPGAVTLNQLRVIDQTGLGLVLDGNMDLSVTNSSFTRNLSQAIMLDGSGTARFESVVIMDCLAGLTVTGDSLGDGRTVKAHGLQVTGSKAYGVSVTSTSSADTFDFGTAGDPGNSVFRNNNQNNDPEYANFVFNVPSTIYAVGNTWDASVQGADVNGKYSVSVGALEVSSGTGPNVYVNSGNTGKIRLAEGP